MTIGTTIQAPRLWGVIHYHSPSQALTNAEVACAAGFHGVMLIDMDAPQYLAPQLGAAVSIKSRFPDLAVGFNGLGHSAAATVHMAVDAELDAAWIDDMGLRAGDWTDPTDAANLLGAIDRCDRARIFAGVGFKYQSPDPDERASVLAAASHGITVTTSGPKTAAAPTASKLAAYRSWLRESPLALASGLTVDNALELLPFVDDALVGTGICRYLDLFDRGRCEMLVSKSQETTT